MSIIGNKICVSAVQKWTGIQSAKYPLSQNRILAKQEPRDTRPPAHVSTKTEIRQNDADDDDKADDVDDGVHDVS